MEFNSNSFVPIPCKRDCPMRTESCHSTCPDYKKYADFKAWQREQRKRKPAEEYSVDIAMRGKDRYHRKHK